MGTLWGQWTGTTTLPDLTTSASGFLTLPGGGNFSQARMHVWFPDADTIRIDIDAGIDGTIDYTYTRTGVSAFAGALGNGHGVAAWSNTATFDNFRVQNRNWTIVDFDYLPGPDGILGTPDDIRITAPATFAARPHSSPTSSRASGCSSRPRRSTTRTRSSAPPPSP